MKKLKVLSIPIMCLFLVLLAACSGGSKDDGKAATEQAKQTTTTETKDTPAADNGSDEPAAVEKEPINLGGRTISISAWWDLTPSGDSASGKALLEQKEAVEKKYNVKINYINEPYDNYLQKFTAGVIAGTPFADISMLELKAALPAALNDQLYTIGEFTTSDDDINNEGKLMTKMTKIANEEYAFTMPNNTGYGLLYNRDVFKELGLPDLQQLYNNGEWNWDKFIEVAKLATKDTNNDGKLDHWGFSGWAAEAGRHFAASNGAKIADDQTGKEGLSDPKTIQALEFLNRLYNVENVVKIKSGKKTEWTERDTFKDGDVAMFVAADWMLGDLPFDFGIVPMPQGPSGTKQFTYADNAAAGYVIPKGVKDPANVYRIFEELQNIPPLEDYPSQNYLESLYKHEEDISMLKAHIVGTGLTELDEAYPEFPYGEVVDDIIVNNVSVTAAVEKQKQKAQAAMDSLVNK